jgi:hypothetical protein
LIFVYFDGHISLDQPFLLMVQLLRSRRPFVAEITDAMGNKIFTVRFQQALCCSVEIILNCTIRFRFVGPFGGSIARYMQKWMVRYVNIHQDSLTFFHERAWACVKLRERNQKEYKKVISLTYLDRNIILI